MVGRGVELSDKRRRAALQQLAGFHRLGFRDDAAVRHHRRLFRLPCGLPSAAALSPDQHMFWFYSHPAVYIMILPAMGVVSELIPCYARRPIFGYVGMVYALMSIAILSFFVWAHH